AHAPLPHIVRPELVADIERPLRLARGNLDTGQVAERSLHVNEPVVYERRGARRVAVVEVADGGRAVGPDFLAVGRGEAAEEINGIVEFAIGDEDVLGGGGNAPQAGGVEVDVPAPTNVLGQ